MLHVKVIVLSVLTCLLFLSGADATLAASTAPRQSYPKDSNAPDSAATVSGSAQPGSAAPEADQAPSATEAAPESAEPQGDKDASFEIVEFKIVGNTLLPEQRLFDLVDDYSGPERLIADVEKAREALEAYYHDAGYPTVLVNIPEQSVTTGVIRLQVIESKTGATTVTGNRYYSSAMILDRLPALAPGGVLFLPEVQQQVSRLNRIADLKVTPALSPGKEQATVDIALKAEDHRPLHGSLEINNRASANTTPLRLNGALSYGNLWQAEHAISLQYQTAPEKPSEVQVFSGSYSLPAPWNPDHSLVLYGVDSHSATGFGEGFETKGNGIVIGTRYSATLPPRGSYSHSVTLGFDYKKFDEAVGQGGSEVTTPIEYLPFSLAYSASHPDPDGSTQYSLGLNASFRGAVSHQGEFADKRSKSRGNYLFLSAGVERRQSLAEHLGLLVKLDGQIADQPLISNEQFSAGGMESVRGYQESAQAGDSAVHGVLEFSFPFPGTRLAGENFSALPYLFYDCASLWTKSPLAGQQFFTQLQGTGLGVRGQIYGSFEYELDGAFALSDAGSVKAGTGRAYFKVKYQF
jgi:hemolysin activation/secretion protein